MSKRGFVTAVKARGKYFFYVRISFRNEEKQPRHKNVMGLGQKENALSLLSSWIEDVSNVPDPMKNYEKEDFERWIKYVESK